MHKHIQTIIIRKTKIYLVKSIAFLLPFIAESKIFKNRHKNRAIKLVSLVHLFIYSGINR